MFDAADAPLVTGWHWLRPGTSQSADWVVGPVNTSEVDAADPSASINIDALVTNKLNGGSGWETTVHVEVYLVNGAAAVPGQADPAGKLIANLTTLRLHNRFLPQTEADTQEIGYAAQAEPIRISRSVIGRYAPEYGPLLLIRLTRRGAPRQGHPRAREAHASHPARSLSSPRSLIPRSGRPVQS